MVVKTLVLGLNVPLNSEDFFSNDFNHQDVLKIFKDLTGLRGALYAVDIHGLSSALNAANRPIILSCPSLAL